MNCKIVSGQVFDEIIGNVYPVRDLLKQFAAQWDKDRKLWKCPKANTSELANALGRAGYFVDWALEQTPPPPAPTVGSAIVPNATPTAVLTYTKGSYYTTVTAPHANAHTPLLNLGAERGLSPNEFNFANTAFPICKTELEKHGWVLTDATPPGTPTAYPPPIVTAWATEPSNITVDLADGLFVISFKVGIDQLEELAEKVAMLLQDREVNQ